MSSSCQNPNNSDLPQSLINVNHDTTKLKCQILFGEFFFI